MLFLHVNMEGKSTNCVWVSDVCVSSVCVQREESVKRHQERSVELLNLHEELGE